MLYLSALETLCVESLYKSTTFTFVLPFNNSAALPRWAGCCLKPRPWPTHTKPGTTRPLPRASFTVNQRRKHLQSVRKLSPRSRSSSRARFRRRERRRRRRKTADRHCVRTPPREIATTDDDSLSGRRHARPAGRLAGRRPPARRRRSAGRRRRGDGAEGTCPGRKRSWTRRRRSGVLKCRRRLLRRCIRIRPRPSSCCTAAHHTTVADILGDVRIDLS